MILKPKIEENNNQLLINVDKNVHPYILADSVRLGQVLINLVGNSAKFTESGIISIFLTALSNGPEIETIRFVVSDTGIGIPKDKLAGIFESYAQAHTGSVASQYGTGLGLSIVKQLIEANGGAISIVSQEKVGTKIVFVLHFKKCGKQEIAKDDKKHYKASDYNLRGLRILLAEDNKMNQKVTKVILEKSGAIVQVAENGIEALQLLNANFFDLLLLDIRMPEMGGIECIQAIRQMTDPEKKDIPAIALTANAIKEERNKCLKSGMSDYLTKPFNASDLLDKVIAVSQKTMGIRAVTINKSAEPASLDTLKKIANGDLNFLKDTISIYCADMLEYYSKMKAFYNGNVLESVRGMAHKMKSSAGLIGANNLLMLLDKIEQSDGLPDIELSSLISLVGEQLDNTIACLQMKLNEELISKK